MLRNGGCPATGVGVGLREAEGVPSQAVLSWLLHASAAQAGEGVAIGAEDLPVDQPWPLKQGTASELPGLVPVGRPGQAADLVVDN